MGLPQGTILRYLLFIQYIKDLLLNWPRESILSDNTVVISNRKTSREVQIKMNDYIKTKNTDNAINYL